ncbi:MAG: hypothetical protein HFJ84_10030 [Clostridiales bacterium]|nr:hypothetical protein [Clostridiales bacterium]
MLSKIKLVSNGDGTYDIFVEYTKQDVEFAADFEGKKKSFLLPKRISKLVQSYGKQAKIKNIKIFVSSVLVASVAFASLGIASAASDRYNMAYLYSGTEQQQIQYVNQTNDVLDTVSPSYFNLQTDGSLQLNYPSTSFIRAMHEKGIRVVPFLSNHWDRNTGIQALKNVDSLSTEIAKQVEAYQLDGVNVDIENVTHEQRDAYTQLVKLLREKIPAHKEVSVAVAANPNDWQLGWHGSYDYSALGKYADHLFLMAYDEHYEGSEAGPVASIDFVERSIQHVLRKTDASKLVVGVPFYGRVWSLDNTRIVGKGISIKTIQDILENCESKVTYDEKSQSVKAQFKITKSSARYTVGGDFVLEPGNYEVWYENDRAYQAKLGLVQKYNLKGSGSWSLGQEDPSIWKNYESWLGGSEASIRLDTQSYANSAGKGYRFLAKVSGGSGSVPTATSSNSSVVTVAYAGKDSRGYLYDIRLLKPGSATITVSVDGKTATLPVTVTSGGNPVLRLDTQSYANGAGKGYRFLAKVSGGSGSVPAATSSNPGVVTVSYAGKDSRGYLYDIRLLKPGSATITVSVDGKTATLPVTVTSGGNPVLRLDTQSYTNRAGRGYRFLAKVSGGSGSAPTATSSNPGVVTVAYAGKDSRGYLYDIRLLKPGSATITVNVDGKTAAFPVTVTK